MKFEISEQHGVDGCHTISRWNTEHVVGFTVIHDTLGQKASGGGTRLLSYAHEKDARADAIGLSSAMTKKHQVANVPLGGAKTAVVVPKDLTPEIKQEALFGVGKMLEHFNGKVITGVDMGVSLEDLETIAKLVPAAGAFLIQQDLAYDTSCGLFGAIEAVCAHKQLDLSKLTIAVQGAGKVGGPFIKLLSDAGCRVYFADADPKQVDQIIKQTTATAVGIKEISSVKCDIFCPCAKGGLLTKEVADQLQCVAVIGCANCMFAEPSVEKQLEQRGILWVHESITSSGGAQQVASLFTSGKRISKDEIQKAVRDTVLKDFETKKKVLLPSYKHLEEVPSTRIFDVTVTRMLAAGNAFDPKVALELITMDPNSVLKEHVHKKSHSYIMAMTGGGKMNLDGKTYEFGPNDQIVIPAGTWHDVIAGPQGCSFYTINVPPILSEDGSERDTYFRE